MSGVPPREGQDRRWVPSNVLWAVLPGVTLAWHYATHLPSESWGVGFIALPLLGAWLVLGLAFWARAILSPHRSPYAALVTPAAACLAILTSWGVHLLPPHVLLGSRVATVFARTSLVAGDDMIMIESDRSNWGYGMFVREDAEDSTSETAILPLGPVESPFMVRVEVSRRAATLSGGAQPRGDMLIVIPLRDGWWYVYADS